MGTHFGGREDLGLEVVIACPTEDSSAGKEDSLKKD
jgi:hypothetical protein